MTPDSTRERARVEGDGVRGSWVVAVAIATLIVMGCGVAIAWEIARSVGSSTAAARWGEAPDDVQAIEMSLLPQSGGARAGAAKDRAFATTPAARQKAMFSEQRRADDSARARLSRYGWSDRAQGTVHIPLARALELLVAREAQRAGSTDASESAGSAASGGLPAKAGAPGTAGPSSAKAGSPGRPTLPAGKEPR